MGCRHSLTGAIGAVWLVACAASAGAQDLTVDVVGTTPLPGLDVPLGQSPYNVQSFPSRMISREHTTGVAPFLDWNANSITLNSPSGNDFQPDVSFRGFAASPLLGTPQGLSVFQDGVRINEAFADVVNWDLLPQNAIASMQLLPGSNPVFGLNTLGGALALSMKNGFRNAGGMAEAYGGSFGRAFAGASAGGSRDTIAGFVAGEAIDDGGWRDHSQTRIGRMYARGDWHDGPNDASLAVTAGDSRLDGTQALPLSMLANPREPYTWPDTTHNRLGFVSATASRQLDGGIAIAANAYYRALDTSSINSNVNGDYDPPESPSEGFNVQSNARTGAFGGTLQASGRVAGWGVHQWSVGASFDGGDTTFAQSQQEATFVNDRQAIGTGPFLGGADVATTTRYYGVYASDTVQVGNDWAVMVAGRYNYARVATSDRSGSDPDVNGSSTYRRFNPAVGATWQASPRLNVFGSVSRGMRVPTAVELTCADPSAPCTLPNIFVADPPLQPVLATTYEAGVRGTLEPGAFYSFALYRTDLANDIQFISAGNGAVNAGYFANVGSTRRQGLEAAAGVTKGEWSLVARYALLDATFQSGFVENSPNNSSADAEGNIAVQPGNRIPTLPRHALRLRADWSRAPFAAAISVLGVTSQYARGDENNADNNGPVPGYAIVSLEGSWQVGRDWQVFARVDNLFDTTYQSFGVLGSNYFRGPGNTFDASLAGPEQFRSPGAPFGAWIGVRYRWDRPA
jgi:outer membrane receptor protein involved in Fe transport